MVFEDTEIRGIHKVDLNSHQAIDVDLSDLPMRQGDSKTASAYAFAFEGSPFETTGSATDDAAKSRLKELMEKANIAYRDGDYDQCEALAKLAMEVDPNELAASMLCFKARAEQRYKDDKWLREPADFSAKSRERIKVLPSEPFVCGTMAMAAQKDVRTRKHPIEASRNTIELPEIANQEVLGEWLIPKGDCLVVSFGPHTIADKDGRAVVRERLAFVEAYR